MSFSSLLCQLKTRLRRCKLFGVGTKEGLKLTKTLLFHFTSFPQRNKLCLLKIDKIFTYVVSEVFYQFFLSLDVKYFFIVVIVTNISSMKPIIFYYLIGCLLRTRELLVLISTLKKLCPSSIILTCLLIIPVFF